MAKSNLSFEFEISTVKSDPKAIQGNIGVIACTLITKVIEGEYSLKVKNDNGTPKIDSTITPTGGDFERIIKETAAEIEKTAIAMVKGDGNGEEVEIKLSTKK
jgi:hypothetical protein